MVDYSEGPDQGQLKDSGAVAGRAAVQEKSRAAGSWEILCSGQTKNIKQICHTFRLFKQKNG